MVDLFESILLQLLIFHGPGHFNPNVIFSVIERELRGRGGGG